MKLIYSLLLALFLSIGAQAQNCNFITNIGPNNTYVIFTPIGVINPSQYYVQWSFGDGSGQVANGNPINHTYANPGVYIVCMSIVDSMTGPVCTTCDTLVLTSCNITYTQNGSVFSFNANGVSPSSNVSWSFGDGTAGTGQTVNHSYNGVGSYTVVMTELDSSGNAICSSTVLINIQGGSTCSFSYVPDSTNGSYQFFGVAGVNPNIVWDFGDGSIGFGTNLSHTYVQSGTYAVCMTSYTLIDTCVICQNITVALNPTNCSFSTIPDSTNSSLMYFNASGVFVNNIINWTYGDGTSGTGQFSSHTYNAPGVYTVCMNEIDFVTGLTVCMTCQPVNINTGGSNPSCQANFVSVSVGLNAYFIDQSVVNPPNVPPLPSPVNYAWSFGDGNSSTLQFPNHQYSNPGTYVVCLVVSTVGCTSTYCDSIVIDTTINNPIGCNAFFVFTQLSPYNLVGVNLSNGTNLNFSWDFGDGSPLVSGAYPSHQYASTGMYIVCLTVSDFFGCSDTYCDTLNVDSLGNIMYRSSTSGFVLNIYSPAAVTSGINDVTPTNAQLFPNPAHNTLSVKWSGEVSNELSYKVVSVDGRTVLNGSLTRDVNSIEVATLSPGFYLLQVQSANGSMEAKSFVKQ